MHVNYSIIYKARKFQCCVAPMIFSKYPLRTRGLGDNISAIGLIYHKKLY
jgi:ADP-dependent phosphofructokinase/glucokinase